MGTEGDRLIIRNIGQLLTMVDPGQSRGDDRPVGLVEEAAVIIRDGVVEACGPESELLAEPGRLASGEPDAIVLDARGGVVSPGLIDPHTHLLFAGWRSAEFAERIAGRSYLEILEAGGGILETVARFRATPDHDLEAWGRASLDRMLENGTTTVEAKTGYGLTARDELRALRLSAGLERTHPITVISTFLGAHAVPPEYRGRRGGARDYLDQVCLPLLPEIARSGLARFCDVFCESGVFGVDDARRLLQEARRVGLGAKLHADEIEPVGGAELAAEVGAVSADHLVRASEAGLRAMAGAGVTAVLLPATTFTLGGRDYAPGRRMLELGLEVALATDFNPGTSPVESLPVVMGIACRTMRLTPAEAFRGVTVAAARAVGLAGRAGQIRVGAPADLVVFRARDYREVPYRLGVNLVDAVVKSGTVVVRDGRRIGA